MVVVWCSLVVAAAVNALVAGADWKQHAAAVSAGAAGLTVLTNVAGPAGGNTFSFGVAVAIDYAVPCVIRSSPIRCPRSALPPASLVAVWGLWYRRLSCIALIIN